MPFAPATTAALLALLLSGCDGHDLTESGDTKGADTEREPYTWAPCTDPEPVLDPKGASTGWVRCADGSVNRVEAVPVDMALYDVRECGVVKPGGCYSDANCTERPNGRCAEWTSFGGPWCTCTYLCSVDADCDEDEVCVTPEVLWDKWPTCHPAPCRTGANCASGECGFTECDVYARGSPCAPLTCRSDLDTCRVDEDCQWNAGKGGNWCRADEEGWSCSVCTDPS